MHMENLVVETLVNGPAQTNTYLAIDKRSKEAVLVDPAWDGERILSYISKFDTLIKAIWLTHAHFDHIAGVSGLIGELSKPIHILLNENDRALWLQHGGAEIFGFHIDVGKEPDVWIKHGELVKAGGLAFEVRHCPGHTPGHVLFYCKDEAVVFCGDLIFKQGIGRADLPGGDYETLMESIKAQVLTLPDETILLPGHGPATIVGDERRENPFLQKDFTFGRDWW
jgi:hydroxyacylglutathione hydrolase